jgi:alkaline phosphatase D
VGRFKTLPPPDSAKPIRIAFFSCQRFEHGYFTPQAGIAADEDLDVVLSLGDYIYEEDATPISKERFEPNGGANRNTETLGQFRGRHRSYRSDQALQGMHARHAVIPVWDDCEVEGNWAGDGPSSGPTPVDGRSIPFAQKRINGINAFFEWMPVDRPRGADRYRIYRDVVLGRHAELFMLDTRQFRDPQPCGDRDFTGGPCVGEDEQPRNRLGTAQKEWLKRGLVGSRSTWKVLGNAQMLMALDVAPGQPSQHDDWTGYSAERRELLEHVRANGVENLTSVVGDVHVYFAGDLYTTGRVDGQRVGTEFVGASISHDALKLPGLTKEQSDLVTEQLPLANPHLKYAEFSTHGYAVMEARAEELRVDFVGVRSTREPTSETFKLASFRVADGVPVVERA